MAKGRLPGNLAAFLDDARCGVHHVVGVLGPPLEVVAGRAGCVVVGFVDAAGLADRFGLGRAWKLSDWPVARGRWLEPNVRNPDRAGAETWIGETLDEPHTRRVLNVPLHAVS